LPPYWQHEVDMLLAGRNISRSRIRLTENYAELYTRYSYVRYSAVIAVAVNQAKRCGDA